MSQFFRVVGTAVLLGALWGVFLRGWMRLLVNLGEFTWEGTGGVIGIAATAGLGLGVVRWARRTGRSRVYRLFAVLAVPLVISPQGILQLLPAFVLGGLAFSNRVSRQLKALLVVGMVTPTMLAVVLLPPEDQPTGMPLAVTLPILITLMVLLALASADLFRRWPQSWRDVASHRETRASLSQGPRRPAVASRDDATPCSADH